MKNFKRAAAAVLSLILALGSLSACGGKTNGPSGNGGVETPEYVYVANYASVGSESGIDYIQSCSWYDGRLYMVANIKDGTQTESYPTGETGSDGNPIMETYEYDTYRTALISIKEDGTDMQELTAYAQPKVPEGMEGNANVNSMTVDAAGNIWIYENLYTYSFDLPDGFDETTQNKWDYYGDSKEQYFIRKLDLTGAELTSIDLSFLQKDSEYYYMRNFSVDSQGNLYIADGEGNVSVLDGDGTPLFEIGSDGGWINGMVTLADGSVAVMAYDETSSGYLVKPIDVASKGFGKSAVAPYNAWNLYPGAGDYDFYYDTGTSFFGYSLKTETNEKLFTWINSDVDSNNISSITPLPDGRILCFSSTYTEDSHENEIVTLTKTPYSASSQKTTLTYACMYLDWNLRSQIIKFNKENENYRIEVKDYSEYNTNEDYSAGLTKLSTEIIAGQVPDIMDTNSLPIRQYAAKGLLEDLWTYIDGDTDLGGRDSLVAPVFNALSQDGKLYQISPSFAVYSVVGASSVVGDEPGWTLDDLYAALETMPEGAEVFGMGTVKSDILYQCCSLGLDTFVDWSTGKCTFDSPEFIKLLAFTDLFPETFDWESIDWEAGDYEDEPSRIASGKQMLSMLYLSDFENYQMYKAMFGGDVTFIGFPTENRDGTAFQLDSGLAMSSKCKNKDGAWEFMRTLLTEDYQTYNIWNYPTNQKAFDKKLTEAMTPEYYTDPVTGEQVEQSRGGWGWGSLEIEIKTLTQEEADEIMALINGTTRVFSYDTAIMDIINEEAKAFFSGQKSPEDTAAMIQSRVSLYVNEQR